MNRDNTVLFIVFSKWKRDTLARVSPPVGRLHMPARRHAHLEGLVPNNERLCVLFIIALCVSNNLADSSEYRNVKRAICPLGRAMKRKRWTLDTVPTARGRCVHG
ncbi:hypothetical protein [Burkholderia ambifaria]|uniref:hypothetical protein n=1 Tax=Burkholderia ambifaria TaxID=152480 RepID=UPI001B933E37|nr:hypothetical protein [Burkholderia ambifaria]MBR8179366.1 hypothetical protein [Burkholderia ambifaria]